MQHITIGVISLKKIKQFTTCLEFDLTRIQGGSTPWKSLETQTKLRNSRKICNGQRRKLVQFPHVSGKKKSTKIGSYSRAGRSKKRPKQCNRLTSMVWKQSSVYAAPPISPLSLSLMEKQQQQQVQSQKERRPPPALPCPVEIGATRKRGRTLKKQERDHHRRKRDQNQGREGELHSDTMTS